MAAEDVPEPDATAEPSGFLVEVGPATRIHFLDWGGPDASRGGPGAGREGPGAGRGGPGAGSGDARVGTEGAPPGVLLIHGLAQTAWSWAPVARRLRSIRHVVAMDLRGHGLSDSPPDGYEPEALAGDAVAVTEGAELAPGSAGVVLAGHGFGAMVAAWVAARLGDACAGLVLVDGGLESVEAASGLDLEEFERGLAEPPEVLSSMQAFLADRAGFDPPTWDADQERAARSTVVEVPAGHLLQAIRPHALHASVAAMFAYEPGSALAAVAAPIVALLSDATAQPRVPDVPGLEIRRLAGAGHNLMRYRPGAVARAILDVPYRPRALRRTIDP